MRPGETRLLLIRHGEAGRPGVLHGHVDVPLTDRGREQVHRLARRLADEALDAVYSSDLSQARDTARILAEKRGLPVVEDPAFRELAMGVWDGVPVDDLARREPDALRRWWEDPVRTAPPGGESLEDLARRVLPALEAVVRRHPGQTVALVAHGGVNRVILLHRLRAPLEAFHHMAQDPACLNRIRFFGDGSWVVELLNG